jgi:glutathione synthase/RimK-type ligase-like ATP-grasp enzyme
MKKIGILYGMENTFPPALADRINLKKASDVQAEHIRVGPVHMAAPSGYHVIVDRISHDIAFYRAYLKNAVLGGAVVINNPFWWSADDRFFNYSLAAKMGVAVPNTAVLPHKEHPPGTTVQSMRNLRFPLDWDALFAYIGFPAFLKPFSGRGLKSVYKVNSPEEFFRAYDQTGTLCMILQSAVNFDEYFRCYVVNREKVRVMKYDPALPHHSRYLQGGKPSSQALHDRITADCLKLCQALGYDFNAVEFAVQNGVPYAIDFLNPVPEADVHSVGPENFEWVVENVAEMAIEKAFSDEQAQPEYRWDRFLRGSLKAAAS